jgi:hypothetical protein
MVLGLEEKAMAMAGQVSVEAPDCSANQQAVELITAILYLYPLFSCRENPVL